MTPTTASNRTAKIVAIVIAAVILVAIVVIELILGATKPEASFSTILRAWALAGLAAGFGWGTLAGHFFHPIAGLRSVFHPALGPNVNLVVAVAPILLFIGIDLIVALTCPGFIYPPWVSALSLLAGCIWGTMVWPVTIEA